MIRSVTTAALIALLTPFATALANNQIDCNRNDLANVEMKFCAGKEFERADAELNAVYKALVIRVKNHDKSFSAGLPNLPSPNVYAKLVASEKSWILLRDQNCELSSATWWGGTGYSLAFTQCRTQETRQRTEFLKKQLDNYSY